MDSAVFPRKFFQFTLAPCAINNSNKSIRPSQQAPKILEREDGEEGRKKESES